MSFVKFFWREVKSDRAFNWFFILCAALGIIGLLLVESFKVGVEDKIAKNAKNFIASDLSISTRRAFDKKELKDIEGYLAEKKLSYAKWIETYSLVMKVQSGPMKEEPLSKLADLNFVSVEFPYYGSVVLEDQGKKGPGAWSKIHETPTVWMSRDLSWELNLKVGDQVKIGEAKFTVGGIILQDQFSSFRGFNLAPKIFLSYKYLPQTDLVKFGSTATYSYAIRLPDDKKTKKIQKELRSLVIDKSIKIVGPTEASQQISKSLDLLTDYLSLITLMTYLLSLVGLYYFTQHFLSKKLKIFSIYKAMGIKTSFLFKVNFLHLIILTLFAVVISIFLVVGALPFLENFFTKLVGEQLLFRLNAISLLRILTLSLGGSLLALGPLFWGALQTPVATIFQDLPMQLKRIKYYYFLPLLLYIIVLAILLANSFKVGALFLGALTAIIILAAICFKGLTTLLDRFSSSLEFVNRHAARTLSRYFTSSFTIFLCLLLGMTLTTFIFQLEGSLRKEFTQTYGDRRPDLFIFDLQDTQAEKFDKLTKTENWNRTMFAPMIRGRLLKINGELTQKKQTPADNEQNFQTREDENAASIKNRGVNLSYRDHLSWSETLVAGKFNGKNCNPKNGPCEISLELNYAKRLGVGLGDKLVFDVSGIEIEGIVTSLRTVKWTSFEPNFFILFQPGILEEAPKTFLASIKVKNYEDKQRIFTKMAQQFPSVSILEVSELVRKLTTIFDLMVIAIKFISFLSLFVALVVLVAVSFNHLELRKREMGLFYMLGLKLTLIKKIYVREFSFLIVFCFILSLVFGTSFTMLIMKNIFDSEIVFRFGFVIPAMAILGLLLFTIVSFRVRQLVKNKNLF
jgi:putative ABC transport system permease protein